MRIKEDYKRSGYFWLPDREGKKLPGTLTVTDGGEIELEIVGLFHDGKEQFENNDISRIVGEIEKDGLVTLEDCFYKKKSISFGGISKSVVRAHMLLCGVIYEANETISFHTASFSIEGINEWVGITGISVSYGKDYRTATVSYAPQEEIILNLSDGFKLHINYGYSLPGAPCTTEAKITHNTYFKLSSDEAREFSEFRKVIHQITYLLCFAIDATVTISDVYTATNELTRSAGSGTTTPIQIKTYYPSLPFSDKEPKIDTHRMLFRFCDIRENAESIINNWLHAYSKIRPAIGLYFSAVSGAHSYLDGRFIALAQGLETYHRRTSSETLMEESKFRKLVAKLLWLCPRENRRWLRGRLYYGNEINLGQRIKRIIEPYKTYLGSRKQRDKLIRRVVNTRNYLTHYSEPLESESAKGGDLWLLCQKLEAIFQLHLLQQLGFTDNEIQKVLQQNYKITQKLNDG